MFEGFSYSLWATFASYAIRKYGYFRMGRVGELPHTRSVPPMDLGTRGPRPTRESQSTQLVGLRFRATLGQEVEVMLA